MKFSIFFLAASVSASTLLAPLYDMAAEQVVSAAMGILEDIKTKFGDNAQTVTVITEFENALKSISHEEIVNIIKTIPIEQIAEGGLTPEDMAAIFVDNAAFDAIDWAAMEQEFINGLPADMVAKFEQSMEAFLHAVDSIQQVFDSEITMSNFVGVFTDVIDAFAQMDDVFGFSQGTTAALRDVLLYTSMISEKALYVYEHFQDYMYMLQDAVMLTELEFERRIQNAVLDTVCTDEFNAVNGAIAVTKFTGTVVIDNWVGPLQQTADMWNTMVGNVPYIDDWQLSDSLIEEFEACVQSFVDSIEGTLVELRVLLLPLRNVIDGTVQNLLGQC